MLRLPPGRSVYVPSCVSDVCIVNVRLVRLLKSSVALITIGMGPMRPGSVNEVNAIALDSPLAVMASSMKTRLLSMIIRPPTSQFPWKEWRRTGAQAAMQHRDCLGTEVFAILQLHVARVRSLELQRSHNI